MGTLICIVVIIGAIILVQVQKHKDGEKAYEKMKADHRDITHGTNALTLYEYGEENFVGLYGEENLRLVKSNQDTELVNFVKGWDTYKIKDEHGVKMREIIGYQNR